MQKTKTAVYPGTFDPITNGHLDIIQRGLKLFDCLIVAIVTNGSKSPLFSVDERLEMLQETLGDDPRVEVDSFDGLLVDYVSQKGADTVLRGLRAVSDFEYEFQMALMNRKLAKNIQTVFLMTGLRWIFISSSIVKEASQFGGDTKDLVPKCVFKKLREKFSQSQ
jgi:pantetheine-phosphate adenylyltransferase